MLTIETYVNFLFIRYIKYQVKHKGKNSTHEIYLLTPPHWDLQKSFVYGIILMESK